MNSDSESEPDYNINPDLDNLIQQMGDITLSDNSIINLKSGELAAPIDTNWRTDVTGSTSQNPIPTRRESFSKPTRGYAGIAASMKKPVYTPLESMMNEPINPFGIYLNLDCLINAEEAIDKWETALRIAVTVNKMDMDTTIAFIEKSLVNNALRFWQNINEASKNIIFEKDNVANIISRSSEAFRLEFVGEGNFYKDAATVKKYTTALLRLQLCDICEIDKYICVYQEYFYHIYNQVQNMSSYLPLFYSKIPDPWGQKLIDSYNPGTTDTLGKRISHLKDKMSEWCGDAILAKLTRGLRKRISLCCDNIKIPTMIGCENPYYYNKIKRKYKKQKYAQRRTYRKDRYYYPRKRYFKKRRTKYYKQKRQLPKKPIYRRKVGKNPKECRCYYCNELGHYANRCPKKFNKNNTKILIDDEIENMITQGDFIPINRFEEINDIDSDESLFLLSDTDYSSSE